MEAATVCFGAMPDHANAIAPSKLWQLAKSLFVGGVATLADWLALLIMVEIANLPPTVANMPALAVGALIQFLGCRHVVFKAARGSLRWQLAGFAVVELLTLVLNGVAFHLLVTLTLVPYWLARPLGTFGVFVLFSFPLWTWVFTGSMKQLKRAT